MDTFWEPLDRDLTKICEHLGNHCFYDSPNILDNLTTTNDAEKIVFFEGY